MWVLCILGVETGRLQVQISPLAFNYEANEGHLKAKFWVFFGHILAHFMPKLRRAYDV